MKCFTVSSLDFAHYGIWGVHFHAMLQAARQRAIYREEAFWKYLLEVRKQKVSDIHRIIRELPDEKSVLEAIEKELLPGRNAPRFTPEDRQAVYEMILKVVKTYLREIQIEIETQQDTINKLTTKFT